MLTKHLLGTIILTYLVTLATPRLLLAVERPYMIWNKQQIAAMREAVKHDADYRARAEAPLENQTWRQLGVTFHNLFRIAVLDDQAAVDRELGQLRAFIGTHPSMSVKEPKDGGLGYGGRHFDNTEMAWRYDLLHDRLTPDERAAIEKTFHGYIDHQLQDGKEYTRTSWLPNMQWPRPMAAHMMAAAIGDRALIEKICRGPAGWFYYFDDYVSDGRFYNEEFGKQYSMNGQVLLFAVALRNLGLDEWGFGYTGKNGGTVRNYIGSYFDIMLPGIDVGTDRMHFGYLTSGDQRHGSPHGAFPTIIIPGQFPGNERKAFTMDVQRLFTSNRMNGVSLEALPGRGNPNMAISKLAVPLWFELSHTIWPDDPRFAYALELLSPAGAKRYVPTPYFMLKPLDFTGTRPAAPSFHAPQRGIAMLRADESSSYWTGPAPAVALRGANTYVHEAPDSFAITNFHAFNRMLLTNGQTCSDYSSNDPDFSNSTRSHTAVMIDGQNTGRDPDATWRFWSQGTTRFVAVRGQPTQGVEQTRALLLTREYLIDVTRLRSDQERQYVWLAQPLGRPQDIDTWQAYDMMSRLTPARTSSDRVKGAVFDNAKRITPDETWRVTMLQDRGADVEKEPVPEEWWKRGIGVRIQMSGEPGTEVMIGDRPQFYERSNQKVDGKYRDVIRQQSAAYGASTIAVARMAKNTTYIALWQPFESGQPKPMQVQTIADTETGVLVKITAEGWSDLVAVRLGDGAENAAPIGDSGVDVSNAAWIRISGDKVDATEGWSDRSAAARVLSGR